MYYIPVLLLWLWTNLCYKACWSLHILHIPSSRCWNKKQKTSCDVVDTVTVCKKKSFQIDKALKMQQSFCMIMFLELIPQPCKGFCKEVVTCTCLSNVLSNEKYDKETIKEYFRQFLSMLWTMEQEGTAILMAITEWVSSLCTFDSLKCPMFEFVIQGNIK